MHGCSDPAPREAELLNGVRPGRDSGGRLVKPPPNFERVAPEAPDWLDAEALAEWERIVPALDELGVLKEADGGMVSAYCETWSRFVTAVRQYRLEGTTIVNPDTGNLHRHPAVGVAETAAAQSRTLGNELGLSPAAERLLNVTPRDDDDPNPFDAG